MQQPIALDALGTLQAYGYRLFGWCNACSALHRRDALPRQTALFDIDLAALIVERGEHARVVGLAPVACPRCGSRDTQTRLLPPRHRSWQ
jgi:hypothetical protein